MNSLMMRRSYLRTALRLLQIVKIWQSVANVLIVESWRQQGRNQGGGA